MPIASRNYGALGSGLARFVLVLFPTASYAQTDEGAATCSANIVPICYGDHASCNLSTTSEIDLYRFRGVAGDNVRLSIAGRTNNLDVRFEVYDSANNLVESGGCSAPPSAPCSVSKGFVLPSTDQFTILVLDAGQNNAGSYDLDLQRIPPLVPMRFLEYGVSETVGLGWPSDHDFLSFEGRLGDVIRVSVSGLTNNLDCAYTVYSPTLQVVDSGSCSAPPSSPCSTGSQANITLPETGTYSLMLHDAGRNNTGNMSVTVTCLLGVCPPNWSMVGSVYCNSNPNSTGSTATTVAWGSDAVADETVYLYASPVPPNSFGLYFMGPNQASIPFGAGVRCIGPPFYRFRVSSSCNRGEYQEALDFGNLPNGQVILPGSTWNFQSWFRDGSSFNLSDGLSITFL